MKAIIMAGGEGTRLRPLTCSRPKPMVPVMNKPVMEHIINLLKKHNILDIGVTLQYMPEVIKDYFGDGRDFGVNISYFIEEEPLGTAGSVKNAQEFLDDTFLVISGDALTDIDLTKAIEFHKMRRSFATLILTRVEVPLEYGVVITERDGRIKGFLEKPSWSEVFSDTVNTGIYVLEPECLDFFETSKVFDFSNDLFPMILNKELLMYGFITEDYWCDIGDLKAYQQAHFDILDNRVKINIPGYQIQGKVWIDEGVDIDKNCIINGPVVIGANCKIKKGAVINPYCILGDNNIIENNSSIKRTIIWNGCNIEKNSQLRGTILCNKVIMKSSSNAFEQSVIGDNTVINEFASIRPNVKVWPNKAIEYGVDVTSNVIWGTRHIKNIFGQKGVSGKVNVDVTPEFFSKLGASFSATFKKSSKIGVSSDGSAASNMLKSAFISGATSLGIETYDFGELILPITRDAIRFYCLDGGTHIGISPQDKSNINATFLDKNGINISKSVERKIENLFNREDFVRCDSSQIRDTKSIINYKDFYLRNILNSINAYNIRTMNYKILLNISSRPVQSIIKLLMKELNCYYDFSKISMMDTKNRITVKTPQEVTYFADQVKFEKYDLGVIIENNSEEMILVDDKGRVIDEDMFMAIASYIAFNTNNDTVVIPHSASNIIDKLAMEHGGNVLRAKSSVQDVMSKMVNNIESKEGLMHQFSLRFDAIFGLVKIIDFISKNNLKLSELVSCIPNFYMSKKTVECAWNSKGKVMRQLIEDKSNSNIELLEGVKIYKDGGWVLVLPDTEKPTCRVISEGYNQEFAESLTDMYANKITDISTKE